MENMNVKPSKDEFLAKVRMLHAHYKSARKMGEALGVHWVTVYRWLKGDIDLMRLPVRTYLAVMGGLNVGQHPGEHAGNTSLEPDPAAIGPVRIGKEDVPVFTESPTVGECFDAHGRVRDAVTPTEHAPRPPDLMDDASVFGYRVTSVAMAPAFEPGAIVFVSTGHVPQNGGYVLTRLRTGEVVLRRYFAEHGGIALKAINRDYPALSVERDQFDWMLPAVWVKLV